LTIAKPRKRNKEKGGGDQSREEKMPHKHELKRTTEWKKKKAFIFNDIFGSYDGFYYRKYQLAFFRKKLVKNISKPFAKN
jgi:hypothetical protein